MRKKIFPWLEREFFALSAEAEPERSADQQLKGLLSRFEIELAAEGLCLDNVVRTRLWGRDRESRDRGSRARVEVLKAKARSASSSFIAPGHFDSGAFVALDLLAMRPTQPGAAKTLKEYSPPIVPLRYLVYDGVVFLSGVTAVHPSLDDQVAEIVARITGSLADAGSSWDRAVKAAFFLHRSQSINRLIAIFGTRMHSAIPQVEYQSVDGYSSEGKLVEIEVTATL
jgi:enamine deaminase RidA (YjgF/YER057c/UK114 family)